MRTTAIDRLIEDATANKLHNWNSILFFIVGEMSKRNQVGLIEVLLITFLRETVLAILYMVRLSIYLNQS